MTMRVIKDNFPNAGLLDKPKAQAEVLPTGQVLLTFPASPSTPSIVVRKEHVELALLLRRLSASDKQRVDYLLQEVSSSLLASVLEHLG